MVFKSKNTTEKIDTNSDVSILEQVYAKYGNKSKYETMANISGIKIEPNLYTVNFYSYTDKKASVMDKYPYKSVKVLENTLLTNCDTIAPEIKGYKFLGYTLTKTDKNIFDYKNTNINSNLNLYPVYEPITYTISYIQDWWIKANATVKYNELYTLSDGNIFYKEGSNIKGLKDDYGNVFELSQIVKNLTDIDGENINLYPVFDADKYTLKAYKPASDYTIYNQSFSSTAYINKQITALEKIEKTFTDDIPQLKGYTFVRWGYFNGQGELLPYDFENKVVNNINLYPIFRANDYNIVYRKDNGKQIAYQNALYDTEIKLLPLETFKEDSYTFSSLEDIQNNISYEPSQTVINLTATDGADINLYAIYTNDYYQLKVNNGYVVGGINNIQHGEDVTIIANEPNVGSHFVKWKSNNFDIPRETNSTLTFQMPAKNIEISAEYTLSNYILIVNNGTGTGTYHYNDVVNIQASDILDGYHFDSWLSTDNDKIASLTDKNTTFKITDHNSTIKAVYKKDKITDSKKVKNTIKKPKIKSISKKGKYLIIKLTKSPKNSVITLKKGNKTYKIKVKKNKTVYKVKISKIKKRFKKYLKSKKTKKYLFKIKYNNKTYKKFKKF